MRDEFTMPAHTRIGVDSLYSHDLEVAVEIEPDEAAACASWYVARCYIEHSVRGELVWAQVPRDHPLFTAISDWAYDEREQQLAELWETYLEDQPRRVRPRTDREEHSTYP